MEWNTYILRIVRQIIPKKQVIRWNVVLVAHTWLKIHAIEIAVFFSSFRIWISTH